MSRQSKQSPTSAWSYITGEKGRNRVRVFEWPGHPSLWIDYKEQGERHRKPIGHYDRAKAKQLADEVAAELGALDRPSGATSVRRRDRVVSSLTWPALFDMYEEEVTATKGESKASHDRRARAMFELCWGAKLLVIDSDRRHWDRYIQMRRAGKLIANGKPVKDGTLALDFWFLRAVINWALSVKENGRPLLASDPFKGFPVPAEANPSQPSVTDEELAALRRAAPLVHPLAPLFLECSRETGHRAASAVAKMRWSDFDATRQGVRWRGENDKVGNEHWTPVSDECARALKQARRRTKAIGDAFIFPSKKDPSKHIERMAARYWWYRLEKLSGIARVNGRGWHSLRRKSATDLDSAGASLKEIMDLHGWTDKSTALNYIKPTEDNLRAALRARSESKRRVNGQ